MVKGPCNSWKFQTTTDEREVASSFSNFIIGISMCL